MYPMCQLISWYDLKISQEIMYMASVAVYEELLKWIVKHITNFE
jgi:hypothetical protein